MLDSLILLFQNIANLFKVKTILSLTVVITTCILTFKGLVPTEAFMTMAGAIVTYYFTRKNTEDIKNENKESE